MISWKFMLSSCYEKINPAKKCKRKCIESVVFDSWYYIVRIRKVVNNSMCLCVFVPL